MKNPTLLVFSSFVILFLFFLLSLTVVRQSWQTIDEITIVNLQNHISEKFDKELSYFSVLGSVEITFGISFILASLALFKLRLSSFLGWLLILPASLLETICKLIIFHPSPPIFLSRTVIETTLPSFYIHTNFSYPSGHMVRYTFLITIFLILIFRKYNKKLSKFWIFLLLISILIMAVSRISLGEHWLSDVLGGGMLGLSAGILAYTLIRRNA